MGILTIQNALCHPKNTHGMDGIKKLLELETNEPKLDDQIYSIFENDENKNTNKMQSQRQKRWYENPYNYPPPFYRPYNTGSESEISLAYIRSSLEDILNLAKSQPPPPPPSFYPVFVPIYVPQVSCGCNNVNDAKNDEQVTTKAPEPSSTTEDERKENVPALSDRFPEMEDERQNWGLLINNTVVDYDDDDDGSRPISLGTISPSDVNSVPGPSVEHGSSQADINASGAQQPISFNPPIVASTDNSQRVCDQAIVSCCLGPERDYECIQSRGCREETLRDNPCNSQNLLRVITRLQSYYT